MMMTEFSIIVPVYKVEQYLRDCLDSLLTGQGDDYEVIAINDCSPDGAFEILKEYEKRYSNFKVVNFERNQGVSAARNAGLEIARGEWILFCDSDDVFMPGSLPFLQEKIRENDCDIVTFELSRVRSVSESVCSQKNFEHVIHDMSNYNDAAAFVCKNFPHRLWAWNKCFHRQLIGDLRFRNFQPCEDAIWVLECMCRAKKVLELPNVLYKYLQHEGSCLATVNYKRMNGDIHGMRGLCDVVLAAPFFALVRTHVYRELRNVFLFRIPYNIEKLNNAEERALLEELYFEAAKHVFVESRLGSLCSRLFHWLLFLPRSLSSIKWFLAWRNRIGRIRSRFLKLFWCGVP